MSHIWRMPLIIVLTLIIASCGGSSGGGSPTPFQSSNSILSSAVTSSITSTNSSSTTQLAQPQNVKVIPGNASATLSWSPVANASGYHIYYATQANIIASNISAFKNGTWVKNVSSPYVIANLQNGETYYFVVTAINDNQESPQSIELITTPTSVDLSTQPTAQEVYVLELVNRARFDPAAEAARYGIGLNDGISGSTISAARKSPLAPNLLLTDSARTHSQWMLDVDTFSHTGANNSTPGDRMAAAGYVFTGQWANGENIAQAGTTASGIDLTEYAARHHEGLFKSPGHRQNILSTNFRELGVGQKQGYFFNNGTNYLSSMLTQNFASTGSNYFITGVIYNDLNGNEFYNPGEGISGATVRVNGKAYSAYSTGAYSIPVSNGNYELVISADSLQFDTIYNVQVNGGNVKVDLIKSGNAIDVVSWK
ncbi:CAP domain-containing protein [Cellvibrio mixtus]|uniref:CAP domain-containing protein n=1 Tax=Cellvibrio mixtus TaxID=39650 RepID=UPI000694DD8A|nr:CAP domain-containing protein [Cellvibrio mixtus]